MASIDRKHVLPASDSKAWPNKKARSSCTGPSPQQAMTSAGATSFPAMATPPATAACAAWMPPAASTTPNGAPSMPAMGHHMPFFMPPPMMPPPMMAMQACMMMQMQMQAMQSMMQQQQQPGADNQQQAKPTPAAAAAASLGYPGPLPCYPPFPFMPMAAPPMCFPPMHAPTAMMQPQATAQPACSSASPPQPLAAAAPAPCQPQQAAPCAATSGAHAPQQRQACASPVPQVPVVPVSDVAATNLSDKDFAAFIDSFVGDDGPVPDAALISRTLQSSCEVAPASPTCHMQPGQEQDAALTALAAGGSSVRSLSGGSDSAEDDFSFYLDDMLPLDAVASQVESSLASYSASTTGRSSKCSGSSERASKRAAFLGSAAELLLQDEEDGEESDLIFGLGCHLDSLLPGC